MPASSQRNWGDAQGGFGTLEGVAELLSNRWLLLAGWIHYLASDLFIGSWEVRCISSSASPAPAPWLSDADGQRLSKPDFLLVRNGRKLVRWPAQYGKGKLTVTWMVNP